MLTAAGLPADIWIEIFTSHFTVQEELFNLASTNRLIRDLTLPTLFRKLIFRDKAHLGENKYHFSLTRTIDRIQALKYSPRLLHHVRTVRLESFNKSPEETRHSSLWTSAYDSVTSLLLLLPHVKRLELDTCIIAPRLHSFIYHYPHLTSLAVLRCFPTVVPEEPAKPPLEELEYDHGSGSISDTIIIPWHARLLEGCLFSLVSLTLAVSEVSQALLYARHGPLALRTLVLKRGHSGNTQATRTCVDLLARCPALRAFHPDMGVAIDCRKLAGHCLSRLEAVSGSPAMIRALVPGRPVHSITIFDRIDDNFTDRDIHAFREPLSAVPVRNLTYHFTVSSDAALRRLRRMFEHVSNLSLHGIIFAEEFINFLTPGELLHWTQLRVCSIHQGFLLPPTLPMQVLRDCIESLIGRPGDPHARVHPTLEEFWVGSRFVWQWYPTEGWAFRDLEPEAALA